MADARAEKGGYSWFSENAEALENFLNDITKNPKVKELVVLGDLFDEWIVP